MTALALYIHEKDGEKAFVLRRAVKAGIERMPSRDDVSEAECYTYIAVAGNTQSLDRVILPLKTTVLRLVTSFTYWTRNCDKQ